MRAKEAVSVPVFNNEYGHGVPEQRPENSVYYHPTLNPSGVPPPGKPQRYRTDPVGGARVPLPLPAAPPLPAGPAPGVLLVLCLLSCAPIVAMLRLLVSCL